MKNRKLTTKELKKLQSIELEMLMEFDRICRKNKLKYVLLGGSAIGAVRHNGFIPWDDDVDVGMLRSDYDKFIEIQKKELNKKKYYFQSMEINASYNLPFGKIRRKDSIYYDATNQLSKNEQGFFIDIFPLDYVSNNNFIMIFYTIKTTFLRILYSKKTGTQPVSSDLKKNIILKILSLFSIFISTKRCKNALMKSMTKFHNTNRITNYGGRYLLKEVTDKNFVEERMLHKFEDKKVYISKNYDKYLKNIYGDYMKLPPKKERQPAHLITEIKFPKVD